MTQSISKTAELSLFENSVLELTAIVDQLEKGQLPLAESLSHFEKGVKLIRQCQKALSEAEQTVQQLTQEQLESITTHE
ncbi:MAG: exodeoxyribonuclease VII small subunit [Coxiellaceae bacterium]|nr:exodeoxyribonuclease VII small subunit [Coxiellaceae bacterium]|tara:strand:+ start:2184 stop:2420 length:237 start_codon:yes stop_codon:yes gene_type:complete